MNKKEKQWKSFGIPTGEPCVVCDKKPAKLEPRFLFAVCIDHMNTRPIDVGDIKDNKEKSDEKRKS